MRVEAPKVETFEYNDKFFECDLLILSAGFEDRSFEFISKVKLKESTYVILIGFENDIVSNDETYQKYYSLINSYVSSANIFKSSIIQDNPRLFSTSLSEALMTIPRKVNNICIDISGMPTHSICMTFKAVRDFRPNHRQKIIYTSAKEYHPTKEEYSKLKQRQKEGVEYMPSSLSKEMSQNLILNCFSGQRTNEGQSCLVLFAGYEVHRSAGVIDNVNPSMLLLLYGKPEGEGLQWRLELSQELHRKFETSRKSGVEVVSTLNIQESLDYLDEYYEYLYDSYDLTIAPVCSKMHAVASYLFWEVYREVQLIFPLPVGYLTEKRAMHVDKTYQMSLQPRNSIYRFDSNTFEKFGDSS